MPNARIRHSNSPVDPVLTTGAVPAELPAIIFKPLGIGCMTLLSFMYAYRPVL